MIEKYVLTGIYCLEIKVKKTANICVGALGYIDFAPGTYLYVGSAQNNLEKRIDRHFKHEKKHHWHVDYLLTHESVILKNAYFRKADKKEECRTALFLSKQCTGIHGFGCTDCTCRSHLFKTTSARVLTSKGITWKKRSH